MKLLNLIFVFLRPTIQLTIQYMNEFIFSINSIFKGHEDIGKSPKYYIGALIKEAINGIQVHVMTKFLNLFLIPTRLSWKKLRVTTSNILLSNMIDITIGWK